VREWSIPNGGYGQVVVIDRRFNNEQSLRQLGATLKYKGRSARNVFIEVFDDSRAASMRDAAFAETLSRADMAFHDKHKIAFYTKNGTTGFHEFKIAVDGVMSGKWITVNY
jgi:hypothetical protein